MANGIQEPFTIRLGAVLAKAYSVARGSREETDAPLDEFFDLYTTETNFR